MGVGVQLWAFGLCVWWGVVSVRVLMGSCVRGALGLWIGSFGALAGALVGDVAYVVGRVDCIVGGASYLCWGVVCACVGLLGVFVEALET